MTLDPAVAAVRLAVRRTLAAVAAPGEPVLVACSGGADSLALLAATVFEAREEALRVIGVTVDHGLQEGSADHTATVVEQMAALGVDETASIRVTVDPGSWGIEAGAREARYAALSQLAAHFESGVVLLGHTLDDQAETVLLGLARGSGGRSLQGMRDYFRDSEGVGFARPLVGLTRVQTESACRAEGIEWWEDPQNTDPRFARSRVRHTVMPLLERELGPGIAEALARTGEQLREDVDFIERFELEAYARARTDDGIDMREIDGVGDAIRSRCARRAAIDQGAIASELSRAHVLAVLGLLGHKGKQIQLPGHVTAYAEDEVLHFRRTTQAG
ncbi:tRNA lysidine(34) synthetase TilS [Marmoricola sp. URHB0036]|uniref:tRNA lysidine(34) synthetase TilS n=1 Tax=Marmoricola sp. URHB0036 TaxID=1298863 RepID=UPI00041697DC|nr:tRNA lysidine(34) synthetase TilS [Marmoricola sp. URHB0036]